MFHTILLGSVPGSGADLLDSLLSVLCFTQLTCPMVVPAMQCVVTAVN